MTQAQTINVHEIDWKPAYEDFHGMPDPQEVVELYPYLDDVQKRQLDRLLDLALEAPLLRHQIVPWWDDSWDVMLLSGGRGVGKTRTGSYACIEHLRQYRDLARIGVGAPTQQDARETCAEGPTGLIKMFPKEFTDYNRSLGEARHVGGGYVKFMGTEKPGRWNGGNWSMLWWDELALCNQQAWDEANPGLRVGPRPRAVCTTTPKNRKWVKALAKDKTTYVPYYLDEKGKPRFPTTFDNPYLPQRRVEWLKNKYLKSRLGRQELLGQFIDDVEGAAWRRDIIHHVTDEDEWARFTKVIVAIDPAGTANRKKADENASGEKGKRNADTAICVAALGLDGRIYILALVAQPWTPNEWAAKAIELYKQYRASLIVAEKNYGGLMVESTIKNAWKGAPVKLVNASDGKRQRAEGVILLDEQERIVHTAYFGEAEDQMCAFINADENEGADLVDARVWACYELGGLGGPRRSVLVGAGNRDARRMLREGAPMGGLVGRVPRI